MLFGCESRRAGQHHEAVDMAVNGRVQYCGTDESVVVLDILSDQGEHGVEREETELVVVLVSILAGRARFWFLGY